MFSQNQEILKQASLGFTGGRTELEKAITRHNALWEKEKAEELEANRTAVMTTIGAAKIRHDHPPGRENT